MTRTILIAATLAGVASVVAGGVLAQPVGNASPKAPATCARHHYVSLVDEYGFRYDRVGNRLDAQGCVIQPPHTLPGAKVAQDQ